MGIKKISITNVVKELEAFYNITFEEYDSQKYQAQTNEVEVIDALEHLKKLDPDNSQVYDYPNSGLIMYSGGKKGMFSISKCDVYLTLNEFNPLIYNQNFYK